MKPKRWFREDITFTFASGASGADLVQSENLDKYEGEILHIHQRNSDNAGNRTAQLTIEDMDGYEIWDGTAKNDNANYDHEFVSARRVLSGRETLKCTISGDPGAGGYTVVAVIWLYGRDG